MAKSSNGEAYNMVIRGGDWGGLDGVDVWGTNIWVHDVRIPPIPIFPSTLLTSHPTQIAVTNKDECVTVKSPSSNILVENIHCNISGGCGMGSLGVDTAISTVTYRNIYTWKSNQMMMIKSNGGAGYVEDVVFEKFTGHSNAYSANIDQYWASMKTLSGSGVQLRNLTFKDWKGTMADGSSRGPVKIACADAVPCTDVSIQDMEMWTEKGSKMVSFCRSGYGSGSCLKSGSGEAYTATTTTQTAMPTGYQVATMKENLATAWGTASSIPIPTLQASYYPGVAPVSKLAGQ